MKIESDQFLTSSEVGVLLQVNPSSVKKWVDDGLLLAFRTPGGHRRIRASDLLQFLATHGMPIPAPLQEAGRRRVLLVDDDTTVLSALSRALRRKADRLQVVTSSNGIDALVLVGSFHPQVVVLDVFMPGVDGLEVCRRLKKRPETRDIEIVAVTGDLTPTIERKAREAGAAHVFAKPVDTQELLNVIFPAREAYRMSAG